MSVLSVFLYYLFVGGLLFYTHRVLLLSYFVVQAKIQILVLSSRKLFPSLSQMQQFLVADMSKA